MRRFLIDNDGSNIFHQLGADAEAEIAAVVRECPANVSTYLVCSGAGCTYYPSTVSRVDVRAKGLLAAHERGVDPFGLFLRGLKAAGKETFITVRMNDVHNPTDADGWNLPRVRREHPDCVVGAAEIAAGKAEWMSYCLDYARPEVQEYELALLGEQAQRYGDTLDGFQLDWMRFPRHLAGDPERVWEQRGVLTEFTAAARERVRAAGGKHLLVGARVPTTPAGCRHLGFDVAEWARRGLVDFLVLCPFLSTEWQIPIAAFRRLTRRAVPLYGGCDFGFGNQCHHPESLRALATSVHGAGADGLYLFNFPCWTEYLAARPYHWLVGLDQPRTAAAKPLLFAVEHRRHRIPGTDQPGLLPAKVAAGATLTLPLPLPKRALPAWRAMVLVHSHGDVTLTVNGVPARPRVNAPEPSGKHRTEIFLEFVDQYRNQGARPLPENCRTFLVDAAALRVGANELAFTNATDHELELERVNLGLW